MLRSCGFSLVALCASTVCGCMHVIQLQSRLMSSSFFIMSPSADSPPRVPDLTAPAAVEAPGSRADLEAPAASSPLHLQHGVVPSREHSIRVPMEDTDNTAVPMLLDTPPSNTEEVAQESVAAVEKGAVPTSRAASGGSASRSAGGCAVGSSGYNLRPDVQNIVARWVELNGSTLVVKPVQGETVTIHLQGYQIIWESPESPTTSLDLASWKAHRSYHIEGAEGGPIGNYDQARKEILKRLDDPTVKKEKLRLATRAAPKVPQKKRDRPDELEEQDESKDGAAPAAAAPAASAHDDGRESFGWDRFISIDWEKRFVRIQWNSGEITPEPMDEFHNQIGTPMFALHYAYLTATPGEKQIMRQTMFMAKPNKRNRSKKHKKQQKTGEQKNETNDLRQKLCSLVSTCICSYCGSGPTVCLKCTHPECPQRVCMQCWMSSTADIDLIESFQCVQHDGPIEFPTHLTVQQHGLPSTNQPQSIAVWSASGCNMASYQCHLEHPLLKTTQIQWSSNECVPSTLTSPPAAFLAEYHSDTETGNVEFDVPHESSSAMAPSMSQVSMLSKCVDPSNTKFVTLSTCGAYRLQLDAIKKFSREKCPETTFLLFDIDRLFVRHILTPVCNTVRQCLLYPHRSPLEIASEHFGKTLLQTYRPYFLFRGEVMSIIHHTTDVLKPCLCGTTLKNRNFAHRKAGWETFERFQVKWYGCQNKKKCGTYMLLPHV